MSSFLLDDLLYMHSLVCSWDIFLTCLEIIKFMRKFFRCNKYVMYCIQSILALDYIFFPKRIGLLSFSWSYNVVSESA